MKDHTASWVQLICYVSKRISMDWENLEDRDDYCSFKFPFRYSTNYIVVRFTENVAETFVDGLSYNTREFLDLQNKLYHKVSMIDPDGVDDLISALSDTVGRVRPYIYRNLGSIPT